MWYAMAVVKRWQISKQKIKRKEAVLLARKRLTSPMYRLTGVPADLWAKVRVRAVDKGENISDVIIRALDDYFSREEGKKKAVKT